MRSLPGNSTFRRETLHVAVDARGRLDELLVAGGEAGAAEAGAVRPESGAGDHGDALGVQEANREFLFPYASVVQVPQAEMLKQIGPSLAVTAVTKDAAFRDALLESPDIDRLNLGPISTMQVSWDQPHEGNLFEFLYRRRALEVA